VALANGLVHLGPRVYPNKPGHLLAHLKTGGCLHAGARHLHRLPQHSSKCVSLLLVQYIWILFLQDGMGHNGPCLLLRGVVVQPVLVAAFLAYSALAKTSNPTPLVLHESSADPPSVSLYGLPSRPRSKLGGLGRHQPPGPAGTAHALHSPRSRPSQLVIAWMKHKLEPTLIHPR
jgi:hypothetical protein